MQRRPFGPAAAALAGVGGALALAAAGWHLGLEPGEVTDPRGPVLAFLIDGLPPLALVYGAYRLDRMDLDPDRRWTVVRWSVVGGAVFLAAVWLTVAVRRLEGRAVVEPAFELLVAADAGALGGALAGYYNARAHRDADRARRTRYALGFVNRLLRHDLRNNITVIRGRADLLAEEGSADPERVRETASVIVDQADRMDDLVDSTGAIAETLLGEAGDERIDLTAVVAEAIDAVDTGDATVTTDLPDRAPVAANEALRSVVENLVENAVEHGPGDRRGAAGEERGDGAGPLGIEVAVSVGEADVTLRVADDGVGIPDDRKGSVFEPRAGTTHGGGLHLVAQLVERFGGAIEVEDSEAGGAAFVIDLPRAEGA
ncbi:MAG: ATP-binding protein [Haloferacaceae archaeon]